MTAFQAVVMAVLQGVTELFPISSLGHAVILPRLLHWTIDQNAPDFLPYLVVMHLGTATALFLYFWRDWLSFGRSLLSGSSARSRADRRIFLFVVLATIPAVVVGLPSANGSARPSARRRWRRSFSSPTASSSISAIESPARRSESSTN